MTERPQSVRRESSAMTDVIHYRGPDDSGYWQEAELGSALGHRRLFIIDLSPEGHQSMVSASGRYVLVYNGEVYNFAGIRAAVEQSGRGPESFRGHSDTEVMLAAIEAWGLKDAVERMVGLFAFALWDRESRELHLVRDRVGIKPIFYRLSRKCVCFRIGAECTACAPWLRRRC